MVDLPLEMVAVAMDITMNIPSLQHHYPFMILMDKESNSTTIEIVQWNPSIVATIGEINLGLYRGVALYLGLICIRMHIWDLVKWPI